MGSLQTYIYISCAVFLETYMYVYVQYIQRMLHFKDNSLTFQ